MNPGLGQDLWYPGAPEAAVQAGGYTESTATDVTDADASAFSSWWDRFTAIWPAFLGLRGEIQDHQNRWSQLATAAYHAGDIEGMRALRANATMLDTLESTRQQVEDTVNRFRDAWEQFKSYLQNLGRWFGLAGLGGLGLPPLLLVIGVPAALAAIAWVVTTYYRLRADLDFDRATLEAAEAGRITPAQAASLIEARTGGPLVSLGLGGGIMPLVLVGGAAVVVFFMMGRRRS